jgi:hypothetical protein
MSNNKDEDYLDEDKPLRHLVKKQDFCVLSMLTPNSFPECKREEFKDQKILGLKVRGVFETYDEAKNHAAKLQKLDKFHNVFVGEVGKWLPFDVDIGNMQTEDDTVYREKSLNNYMKSYKDSLKEEEILEKERKEEQLKGVKVVTGKSDAPVELGLGTVPDSEDNQTVKENLDENIENGVNSVNDNTETVSEEIRIEESSEDNLDSEIKKITDDRNNLINDLNESKEYMKTLEEKMTTISEMFSLLKSK